MSEKSGMPANGMGHKITKITIIEHSAVTYASYSGITHGTIEKEAGSSTAAARGYDRSRYGFHR